MAHQVGNRWYPDFVGVRYDRVELDPALTPMENLWRVIYICCAIWLAKYRVFGYEQSTVEELEQEFRLRTFLRLRDHVRNGSYRKDLTLYLNTRSAAWGVCTNVLELWGAKNIIIPSKSLSIDLPVSVDGVVSDELTLGDSLASHEARKLCLVNKSYNKKESWTLMTRRRDQNRRLKKDVQDMYDAYVEDCLEFFVEPVSREQFIDKNLSDKEKEILHYKVKKKKKRK